MSNTNSLILDKVIENVVDEVLRERAEEGGHETTIVVVPKEIEVVVEEGEARAFYSNKGAKAFQKHLAKEGFIEERGFKLLVSPFKEEIERWGWEKLSQHREPRLRALIK